MDGEWGTQVTDPLYIVARAALLDALDALGVRLLLMMRDEEAYRLRDDWANA